MYTTDYSDLAFFVLRFAVGVIFISHSLPKIKKQMPFGAKYRWANFLISIMELAGGLLIISGLWIREAAVALSILMLGAIYFHLFIWRKPFRKGLGMAFLLFAALILLALTGGGNWRIIL